MPQEYAATSTSNAGYHEWRPYSRHPLVIGGGYGVELARLMLHEMRWRGRPRQWALRITAGVLVAVLYFVALVMMLVVRPAGSGSVPGTGGSGAVAVRLINRAPPAPAPPPISLPQRPVTPATPPAATAQAQPRAPARAVPPVVLPASRQPTVTPVPLKPQVATPPPAVAPPRVHRNPPPALPPPITLPPPVKVVAEPSRQAIPVPAPPPRLARPKVLAASPPPMPTQPSAPTLTLAEPPLNVRVPPAAPVRPVSPANVATPPVPLPQVEMPPPAVQVTAVKVPAQVPGTVRTLPVPTVAPTLPLAQVQAPGTSASVAAVAATVAKPSRPAARVATGAAPVNPAAASSSFATARGRFTLAPRNGSHAGALARQARGQPGTVKVVPHGNSDVMTRGSDRLGYTPTIFAQDWAPANESILDTFLRRFIEKLTVTHTFHLAPGVRVHCVLGPIAVFLACGGDPPRPESAKSNDPRLDMAPARQLVPGLAHPTTARPATAPAVHLNNNVMCEVAKVAGSPPPPGCPGGPAPATSTRLH